MVTQDKFQELMKKWDSEEYKQKQAQEKRNRRIQEIKDSLAKVTPGNWGYVVMDKRWGGVFADPKVDNWEESVSGHQVCKITGEPKYMMEDSLKQMNIDMRFIANSKTYIQDLLDEVARLKVENLEIKESKVVYRTIVQGEEPWCMDDGL